MKVELTYLYMAVPVLSTKQTANLVQTSQPTTAFQLVRP